MQTWPMLLVQMALAQHGPACQPGRLKPRAPVTPFILSLWLSVHLFWVCTGVWGPGSFKHCSKSIALIKGITSQKREKQETHTQAALRSSVKLDKSEIYKANVCHIANDNTRKRFLEQKNNIAAKTKERALRFHYVTRFCQCTSLMMNHTVSGPANVQPGLQVPPVGHSGGVWPKSYPGTCILYMHMCMCTGMYCICECLCVSVYACHHKRVVGWFTSR